MSSIAASSSDIHHTDTAPNITIPGWFLWLQGGLWGMAAMIILPWATWVTVCVFGSIAASERLTNVERTTESLLPTVKVIEATRFTANDGRQLTAGLELRFDRLEAKFEELRRDIDKGNRPKGMP